MKKKWVRKEDWLAFFLPLLTMLMIFIIKGIFPFGKESFLRTDLYHQYAPFLREFQAKLQSFSSLSYSFNLGLGVNFSSLLSYYLASPLNFFVIFFPKTLFIEYITYLIVLKIALSGMTASIYFRKHFRRNDYFSTLFGMLYALSGYIAAYSWNVMWLDCIFLFPLILLGLENMLEKERPELYTVTLALSILSNYYISIMICLFLVFYFLSLLFYYGAEEIKLVGKRLLYFALYSILSALIAAAFLLPAIFALRFTASSGISFPKTITQYFTIIDMAARLFPFVETEQGLKHWPNIYAGALSLFILPLYFKNPAIQMKKKCIFSFFVLFFFLSFSINALNFIWHGFHYPNSLPARQSFLFIFLLLTAGAEWYGKRKLTSRKDLSFSLFLTSAFVILCQKMITEEAFHWSVFYLTLLFLFLYFLLFVFEKKGLDSSIFTLLLIALCFVEASLNMAVTSVPTTDRNAYLEGRKETEKLVKEVRLEDDGFYRFLREDAKTKDDGALMRYNSASIFSSTAYGAVSDWYTKLGMEASTNAYSINGATPLMKSLLALKYEIVKEEPKNSKAIGLSYVNGEGGYRLYENQYALPLGYFLTKEELSQFDLQAGTPALVQNSITKALEGEDILEPILGKMESSVYTFTVEKSGDIYVYVNNEKVKEVKAILPDGEKSFDHVDRGYLLSLGYLEEGSTVELKSQTENESMDATAYSFSFEVLSGVSEKLLKRSMEVTKWKDGSVKARLTAAEDGILFTSIPYDPGWKVKVDGKTVEPEKSMGAFLGIPVREGEHEMEMQFTAEGSRFGLLLSVNGLLLFALFLFLRKRNGFSEGERDRDQYLLRKREVMPGLNPEQADSLMTESEKEALHVRSRKRGNRISPYRGKLPNARGRVHLVEKMDVKE